MVGTVVHPSWADRKRPDRAEGLLLREDSGGLRATHTRIMNAQVDSVWMCMTMIAHVDLEGIRLCILHFAGPRLQRHHRSPLGKRTETLRPLDQDAVYRSSRHKFQDSGLVVLEARTELNR